MEGDLVYCNDIDGLMAALMIAHDPDEWRVFIDTSKTSLKAILLHNGNFLPSIPVGHAFHMKETYGNMKQLLRCIKYDQHQWQLCGDLKVVALLLGLQGGYTKTIVFFVNGTAETGNPIMSRKSYLNESHWSQERKCPTSSPC